MKKNKQVLIIGRDIHPDGKETAVLIEKELEPYLKKRDLDSHCVLLKDIIFDISNEAIRILDGKTGNDLADYQVVLMTNWFSHASIRKDMALSLALYFQHKNVAFMNSEALNSRSTSKLSQMMFATLYNVPISRTIFSLSVNHLKKYLTDIEFAQPFIYKDAQASRGKGNYLLHKISDIENYRQQHTERSPFMAQTFVESDNQDYRFFVTGSKARLVMKRMGDQNGHLNNTSAGATTKIIKLEDISPQVLKYVHTMSKVLHRELSGIDIIFDKTTQQPYFLEANPIPQIATGTNTSLKLDAVAEALEAAIKGRQA